jgi:tryptophan synthase beta chain
LVNLSGRGDKDIGTVADLSNGDFFCRPSCQGQSVKGGVVSEQPMRLVAGAALRGAATAGASA